MPWIWNIDSGNHWTICSPTFRLWHTYRMNTNYWSSFRYLTKTKWHTEMTHNWKEKFRMCFGTLVEFNVCSICGSAHIKAIICFLPDTWHVNSCTPSSHCWSYITSSMCYRKFVEVLLPMVWVSFLYAI
jgi:hypothetical protein